MAAEALHHLSVDIESYSDGDIKKAGLYKSAQSPASQILLFAYSLDGAPVQVVDFTAGETIPVAVLGYLFDPNTIKHAYNSSFEVYCLSRYFDLGGAGAEQYGMTYHEWLSQWRCTMLHGMYLGYPGGLDACGKALGLPQDKQKMGVGKSLIRYFCVPCNPTKANGGRTRNLPHHDPGKWELFKEYNAQDVVTEMEIENRLANFPVPDEVQKQWELDLTINARGVAVDRALVASAQAMDAQVRQGYIQEAQALTGLENPNSVAQLTSWLTEQTGEELPDLSKGTVAQLLKSDLPAGSTRRLLEIRQELGKTSNKKYDSLAVATCDDGRVRGLLQFYGANRTGRWAGRIVQPQNLPRTYIHGDLLPMARELVKAGNADGLKWIFGSVPDTLSQLIRTAFVASPGDMLLDADFSAIEARVIAWLAGEEWVLEVFRTHGKIYEATAAQMFNIPIEKIKKGQPEYAYRQKGKVATLALGYQGGVGAMRTMDTGHELDSLSDAEVQELVDLWRKANPNIVKLWRDVENAAKSAISFGREVILSHGLKIRHIFDTRNDLEFMCIQLPSKRCLYYPQPAITQNRFGRPSISYMGQNQTTKKWERIETYGGKLVENCLAADTPVLTDRGVLPISLVQPEDRLWDGLEWVRHDGLIEKGTRETLDVDGVRMTPDHKIFTDGGWICASSCERYNRITIGLPDGYRLCRVGWKKVLVEYPMRLWEDLQNAGQRISEGQAEVLRMHAGRPDSQVNNYAWAVQAPDVSRVALNERTVPTTNSAGLGELRRPGHKGLRPMAREFREFLCRHVPLLRPWFNAGPSRCKRRLLPGKLPLGIGQSAGPKQKDQSGYLHTVGPDNGGRGGGEIRDRSNHATIPDRPRMPGKFVVRKTGRNEQVYDIRNAGPRHRFTVITDQGAMLVHNCVQAVARDCLSEAITRLEAAGYPVVFHIHDEIVVDAPMVNHDLSEMETLMSIAPIWAPGLPLNADGWVNEFFKKD